MNVFDGHIISCDWLTFRASCSGPRITGDLFIRINPETGVEHRTVAHKRIEGSYESGVMVRCDGGRVWFTGNPSRFGRGDNLLGYDLASAYKRSVAILGLLGISDVDDPVFTRVDLNANFVLGSQQAASDYLGGLSVRKCQRTRANSYGRGETVTFGEGSKVLYQKLYNKALEMLAHGMSELGRQVMNLGIVRYECEYKSMWLRDHADRKGVFDLAKILYVDFAEKAKEFLRPTESSESILKLPKSSQAFYWMWRAGQDCREFYSQAQWYRHRKAIVEALSIDVSYQFSVVKEAHVKVVEPRPFDPSMVDGYSLPPAHLVSLKGNKL